MIFSQPWYQTSNFEQDQMLAIVSEHEITKYFGSQVPQLTWIAVGWGTWVVIWQLKQKRKNGLDTEG